MISLGGSVLIENFSIDTDFLNGLFSILNKLDRFAVVVGGGSVARIYTSLKLDNSLLDILGIKITRVNAFAVKSLYEENTLDNAKFITSLEEITKDDKRIFSGGFFPGFTTDACSVLLAERMRINRVINISNIEGVYDKDPHKSKDAKLIRRMSFKDFLNLGLEASRKPGSNFIFDLVGIKLAERSSIDLAFVGKNLKEIEKAIKGEEFFGSLVSNKD